MVAICKTCVLALSKYALDESCVSKLNIPECISPQPAGAGAMAESVHFKVRMSAYVLQ